MERNTGILSKDVESEWKAREKRFYLGWNPLQNARSTVSGVTKKSSKAEKFAERRLRNSQKKRQVLMVVHPFVADGLIIVACLLACLPAYLWP